MDDKLILVADDAAFMRKMVRMTLSEIGLTNIIEAKDGNEAVDQYREKHPDLVLLDITMANKNGLEALREIMELDPAAQVIMCTAIGQQQTVMEALALGAADYVIKPFQKDKLSEAVLGVLGVS
ncbi:MAG: response regulator [Coriobacteriales bacterium]|nr:response regulator [Coriobacteriales bacterium]